MKKFISLFLVLVLCLMLTACQSEEAKATEDAGTLLSSEDSESTVDTYATAGDYEELPQEEETEPPVPVTVEITMDNWEEYFEFRVYGCNGDQLNIPDEGIPAGCVFLKEEYKQKLVDTPAEGSSELNVFFTIGFDVASFSFTVDTEGNRTFSFHDEIPNHIRNYVPTPREIPLIDNRTFPGYKFFDYVEPIMAIECWYSGSTFDDYGIYAYMKNPYVLDVRGTLTFLP